MLARHVSAVLLAGLVSTCRGNAPQEAAHAQPAQPAQPAAAPVEEARTFAPADVAPSPLVHRLRQLPADQARVEAMAALTAADAPSAGRLRWMAAERGESEAWRALASSDHPLAPWAGLRLAEALEAEAPAEALSLASALSAVDYPGQRRAQAVAARARLALAEAEAPDALRALLAEVPAHVGGASVAMPLADRLAGSESVAEREEALALYRRVASRAPRADVGREAAAKAERVLASLPSERRRALARPSVEDRFAEAEALYQSMQHDAAEHAFAALARELRGVDEAKRCEAEGRQGAAMVRQRERVEAAALLADVATRCDDPDVKAWARYRAGRALFQVNRADAAREQLTALEREVPTHSLADDARFRLALVERDRGQLDAAAALLEELVTRYPDGDMRGEALFVLALDAHGAGDKDAALRHLGRLLVGGLYEVPSEDVEGLRGRAGYWRAKVLAELGRTDDAIEGWLAVARAWPLTYYAQLATSRLRELAPTRAAELEAELRAEETPLRFAWRAELDAPWFGRFVELLRVDARDEALAELEHAGALRGDDDLAWIAVACLAQSGALPEVARLVRRRLEDFRRRPPRGMARHFWRLAYPRAYAPLVEEAAAAAEVPASFVRAIAREESSFDPNAVSWAHAYGLVQVILPTARRHADGLTIDARTLRRPEVNLAVGSRYMRSLRDRYATNPAVVPAAYNAGQGALDRWLRERGQLPLDEFVERIPYDETRRYTRRVLQTWSVYTWLDEDRLLELAMALPQR
ncbi:MAG: transglycosylase SLT domain-containing protein [Sandaracinus sp.]|nr:transglycosylase SLT domain-containing protein [Sandaracinus sp.]